MPNYDYAALESLLRQALELAQGRLAPVDAQYVLEFLDAAEYGLAFETLACSVVDVNAPLSPAFCALMQDAARWMGYSDDFSQIRNREVAAALALVWEARRDCAE